MSDEYSASPSERGSSVKQETIKPELYFKEEVIDHIPDVKHELDHIPDVKPELDEIADIIKSEFDNIHDVKPVFEQIPDIKPVFEHKPDIKPALCTCCGDSGLCKEEEPKSKCENVLCSGGQERLIDDMNNVKSDWSEATSASVGSAVVALSEYDNPFGCSKCEYRSNYQRKLKQHMKKEHSDLMPYSCSQCPCSFKYKGNLTQHTRRIHMI